MEKVVPARLMPLDHHLFSMPGLLNSDKMRITAPIALCHLQGRVARIILSNKRLKFEVDLLG
jgi:hypothetical protein